MYLEKTIRNLGLDPKNQLSMVHMVKSLCLSTNQKKELLNAIREEVSQEESPTTTKRFAAQLQDAQSKSSTFLGKPFLPAWRGSPPGMSKRDNVLWQRYLDKNEKKILQVYYNVKVGTGTAPPLGTSPQDGLSWILSSMLRIDVVVEKENEVLIMEVRPDASRSAFGAVIMYRHFWRLDLKIDKPAQAIILTDNITPQVCSCCVAHNVAYNVV